MTGSVCIVTRRQSQNSHSQSNSDLIILFSFVCSCSFGFARALFWCIRALPLCTCPLRRCVMCSLQVYTCGLFPSTRPLCTCLIFCTLKVYTSSFQAHTRSIRVYTSSLQTHSVQYLCALFIRALSARPYESCKIFTGRPR